HGPARRRTGRRLERAAEGTPQGDGADGRGRSPQRRAGRSGDGSCPPQERATGCERRKRRSREVEVEEGFGDDTGVKGGREDRGAEELKQPTALAGPARSEP